MCSECDLSECWNLLSVVKLPPKVKHLLIFIKLYVQLFIANIDEEQPGWFKSVPSEEPHRVLRDIHHG